jgi:hypothetical protein
LVALKRETVDLIKKVYLTSKFFVFSYDKNQQGFVLKIYDYLKRENIPVWIDIYDEIDKDISNFL